MVNIIKTAVVAALCLLAGTALAAPTTNNTIEARGIYVPPYPDGTSEPTVYCKAHWKWIKNDLDIYFKNFKDLNVLKHGSNSLVVLLGLHCNAGKMVWDHAGKELGWDYHLHATMSWGHADECIAKQLIAAGIPNPFPMDKGKPWKGYCHGF